MAEIAPTDIVAQTERLVLRRVTEGDLDAWLVHLNTPDVTAHLGGPRTREEVAEKFARMDRSWEAHGFSFLMMTLRPCGTFLGTCGIGHIEQDYVPDALRGAVQIGWQLRADYWGRGFTLEAARAMMAFGFGKPGIGTIYSQTSAGNRQSWRLMEKLGMQRRADLDYADPKYPPQDNPTIIYAIDRAQWASRQGVQAT